MRAYPAYLDFTKPRMGHDFKIVSEEGEFENQFKVLSTTIYYDPTSDDIHNGDVIYFKLPSQKIGMFKLMEINQDENVENILYCRAVFCGYSLGKPNYFQGFLEAWEKYFPSQQLPPATKKILPKNNYVIPQKYNNDTLWIIGVLILGIIAIGLFCHIISIVGV